MKTLIHVNQHVIRKNQKTGARDPVLTVKRGKSNDYAHEAEILDRHGEVVARVVYRHDRPLSCGARVWIDTEAPVRLTVHGTGGEQPGVATAAHDGAQGERPGT